MKFYMRINIIYALATDVALDALESQGLLHITDDNGVFWVEDDWEDAVASFWISREFIGVVRINEEDQNVLRGRVKIFRVKDLAWTNEDADLDDHRAIAQLQFALPEGFQRTEENLLKHSCGFTDQEFARPILSDLIMQTGADVL